MPKFIGDIPSAPERRSYDWEGLFTRGEHYLAVEDASTTFDNAAKSRFQREKAAGNIPAGLTINVLKVIVEGDEARVPSESEEATHWLVYVK